MLDNFVKKIPEGWIKYGIGLILQMLISIALYLSKNNIETILIATADLTIFLILFLILYTKYIKNELKKDFLERLGDKDKIINEKNLTITQLQNSLKIKQSNKNSKIQNLAEPDNN